MTAQIDCKAVLSINALSAGYSSHVVVDGVDLTVQRGEWCTLLGPNGTGKSTLLYCVVGQITPLCGSIHVNCYSMAEDRLNALRYLGFACPPDKLPGLLTGRQCLEIYAAAKELERIDREIIELAEALNFSRYMDDYVDTYSLGTRGKLSILLALLGAPSLIVLDETFNGLDPASSLLLKRSLREKVDAGHCGVLLATHALDIVEHFSDKAALLLDGSIVRTWDRAALFAIREGGEDSLERELAAAVE